MSPAEVLSLPVHCQYCSRPILVECIAEQGENASCQCPYEDCRKIAQISGLRRVISVRADPLPRTDAWTSLTRTEKRQHPVITVIVKQLPLVTMWGSMLVLRPLIGLVPAIFFSL